LSIGGRLTRGGAALALLVVVLGALLVSSPAPAAACTCEYVAPLDARDRADAVLSGRVRSVTEPIAWPRLDATFPFVYFAPEPDAPIEVSVEVATVWKGQIPSVAEIRSQNPAMDVCGASFAPGDSYLFYAMQEADGLRRAFCQQLVPIAQAGDDLAQLGPGVAPVPQAQTGVRREVWLLGATLLGLLLLVFAWRMRRHRRPAR
jgi:hypothetical protein